MSHQKKKKKIEDHMFKQHPPTAIRTSDITILFFFQVAPKASITLMGETKHWKILSLIKEP